MFGPLRARRAIASREVIKISVRPLPSAISSSRVPPSSRARILSLLGLNPPAVRTVVHGAVLGCVHGGHGLKFARQHRPLSTRRYPHSGDRDEAGARCAYESGRSPLPLRMIPWAAIAAPVCRLCGFTCTRCSLAPTPPGTPPSPRRGYRPPRRSGPATVRDLLAGILAGRPARSAVAIPLSGRSRGSCGAGPRDRPNPSHGAPCGAWAAFNPIGRQPLLR